MEKKNQRNIDTQLQNDKSVISAFYEWLPIDPFSLKRSDEVCKRVNSVFLPFLPATKQAPSKSGYQSTTLSMPHSYVTGTLYNKQTGGYSTTPLTKSSLNTKPSTSTMSLSTKLSTSRLLLSTNLSLKQSSVIDVSYSKQTSRNGLSPGSKLYFTPTSATSNASRSNTILTSTFLLLTFNHQNTWSSNASPNPNSYLITTPSTSSSRSAAMSTLTNLLSRIYSKYLTENIWTSLKANLSLDNSSTSSIRSSTQTTAELKGTSRPLTLFNMTTNSGKKTEMGSSGTTIPKSMFNVPSSVPTTTVAISTRAAINITRTLPTKTIVASGGTTILSIPSNVTSSLPINTVISPTKTSIPQILFNVTSRTPTKTDTVVASQWTTLSPIQSTKTLGFNTKMKLTSHKAALLTNVLITTRFRTGNAAKSTCTAKQLNHFNTTTSSSSKMEIPSKVTTLSQILSNKTLKHLTTNNGITDNIDHTSFNSNNTFIQPKTVITKVFNKMTSTTVRQSNIIIKVNWTTVSNQSETSKPAIIDVTTNSSFIYNSFQPNTTALGVRTPSWSSQTSPSTTSVKGENSVTVINKFYTPIPTIPAVVRGTTGIVTCSNISFSLCLSLSFSLSLSLSLSLSHTHTHTHTHTYFNKVVNSSSLLKF